MTPEHQSNNIASWEIVAAGIEEYPDNEAWLPWKPLVRRFLRAGIDAGLNRYFRVGQSMHEIIFSTLDHHGFRGGEPRVTVEFHPPTELRILYGTSLQGDRTRKLKPVLRFEDGVTTLSHYLHQLWTATIPGPVPEEIRHLGVSLPPDIATRLRALDYDPAFDPKFYADSFRRHGGDFVRGYVGRIEESMDYYLEWSPRLRDFAADCRKKNPCPDPERLDPRDRAKLPIYESLIRKASPSSHSGRKRVLICSIPLVGMSVAKSLWPGEDNRAVVLTPDELSAWDEIYKNPELVIRWFINYWWEVKDPAPDKYWNFSYDMKTAPGTVPWLVRSGESSGDLSGGEDAGLWSWDGKQAEYVRQLWTIDF
ncbi:hypothetical protein DES53_101272 [Roseimicrobium gellanilyticum]|uniref:Uncharacterized protein n=1 Tax=Roseimicrobium gellanilyticum TaxID=748857 RepID=A0A366HVF8_9BACT|nr:hypothetical protein [Roseimicrobium gellanilyticum]RBP47475.1 hypothetical protein DES53_101272 [Roseimicrobium gellanilyticum]